ncbi:sialic acid-binding Ig-like lectin 5 [Leucoraja erinacea]|uniref:sialic acid-binding Ig-like lectin 5 n=1 Tax=Leucoraja erinaceus TaxID=7782 RepID=UPI00245535A0|nr:sialic acid-binding Ig-like lectin 5 [Leucoraja erinacea]
MLFLLSSAAVSTEWTINVQLNVTAQRGLCARIPCNYSYPSRLNKIPPVGIWINDKNWNNQLIAFHSRDHSNESSRFYNRTRLSGALRDGNCTLVIYNISQEDEGPYHFRIEFINNDRFSFFPVTRLRVSDFTDKPSIFPVETVEGKTVNITCTFNTTCDGTASTLTWVTPNDEPLSVSHSITQWSDSLTHTSVVSLTPALKHHRQNLTCRFRYRTVSSEQTLTLTVQCKYEDYLLYTNNNSPRCTQMMPQQHCKTDRNVCLFPSNSGQGHLGYPSPASRDTPTALPLLLGDAPSILPLPRVDAPLPSVELPLYWPSQCGALSVPPLPQCITPSTLPH